MKISCINIFEYFVCSSDLKSALSDYYVKNHNCSILSANDDSDEQIGLLIYEEKTVVEVLYTKAADPSVKKGMLDYLIASSDKIIRYRIVGSEDDEKIALDCGFRYESSLNIYKSIGNDHPYAPTFWKKYNRLYDYFAKRDYHAVSFEDLNEEQMNQIRYNLDKEFVSEFNPGKFLDNNFSDLSKRISTAIIKDGKVAAYSLLRCVGNSRCIFEILCVAKSHRKTPLIVPAIMRSVNEVVKAGMPYITFAVYQRNTEMIKILENDMKDAIKSVTVQHNLIYIKDFYYKNGVSDKNE